MSQDYINILKFCKYFGLSSALNALLNSQCEQFTKVIGFLFANACLLLHRVFPSVGLEDRFYFLKSCVEQAPLCMIFSYAFGFYLTLLRPPLQQGFNIQSCFWSRPHFMGFVLPYWQCLLCFFFIKSAAFAHCYAF